MRQLPDTWPLCNLLGLPVAYAREEYILTNVIRAGEGFAVQLWQADRQQLIRAYVTSLGYVSDAARERAARERVDIETAVLLESGRQYGEALTAAWSRNVKRGKRRYAIVQ